MSWCAVVLVVLMLNVASLTYAAEGPSSPATQQQMNDLKQLVNDLKSDLRQQITELKGITARLEDTNAWLRGLTWVAGGSAAAIVIALTTAATSVALRVGRMEATLKGVDKRLDEQEKRFDKQLTRLEDAVARVERSRPE